MSFVVHFFIVFFKSFFSIVIVTDHYDNKFRLSFHLFRALCVYIYRYSSIHSKSCVVYDPSLLCVSYFLYTLTYDPAEYPSFHLHLMCIVYVKSFMVSPFIAIHVGPSWFLRFYIILFWFVFRNKFFVTLCSWQLITDREVGI